MLGVGETTAVGRPAGKRGGEEADDPKEKDDMTGFYKKNELVNWDVVFVVVSLISSDLQ